MVIIMSEKEKFIEEIDALIDNALNCQELTFEGLSKEAQNYYNKLKTKAKSDGALTENGEKILTYMKENYLNCGNQFTARKIGEGIFMSGRSVSGAMQKLVKDGYVSKSLGEPVMYSLYTE
jgi:hypothetical protein